MPLSDRFRMSPYLMICLIGFFAVSSFSLISPILSLFAKDYIKATIVEIGIITSAFFVASASVKIPLGILGGGNRTPIIFASSLLLLVVLPFSYTVVSSPLGLALVRIIHGIAFTLAVTVSLSLAPLTVSGIIRNRAVATYSILAGTGLVSGSAIGTLSIAVGELKSVFYVASALAMPGFLLGFAFTRRLYSIESRWLLLEQPVKLNLRRKVSHVISEKKFLASFFACLAYFFVFGTVLAYAPIYATQRLQLPYVSVTTIFFGCYLTTTLTRLPLNRLVSKLKSRKEVLILSAQLLSVILALVISLSTHSVFFALAIVFLGIGQGIVYPVGAIMASESAYPSDHVLASSLYLVAWDLGLALGPALTSKIAATSGVLAAIATSSILPAISALTMFYLLLTTRA
jgi:DHA1 family multidrug resistance protein-like MFS transporter